MLSLFTASIAHSHLNRPSEEMPHVFIIFLFLLMVRLYIFISQKSIPVIPSTNSSEVPDSEEISVPRQASDAARSF